MKVKTYSEDDKICHDCVGEEYLSKEIGRKGKRGKCAFCKQVTHTYTLVQMTDRIEQTLLDHYECNRPSIFKAAAHDGRCLILSTGFFEWRHIKRRSKKTGKELQKEDTYPYYITLKDHAYFYMAGVYQPWTDKKTGEHVNTTAIVTAPANRLMYHIHNTRKRMPAILNDELAWKWMMEDLSDEEIMEIAGTQHNYEEMDYCSVSHDFKAKLEPEEAFAYSEPELPAFNLSIEPGEETLEQEQLSLF